MPTFGQLVSDCRLFEHDEDRAQCLTLLTNDHGNTTTLAITGFVTMMYVDLKFNKFLLFCLMSGVIESNQNKPRFRCHVTERTP